MTCHPDRGLQSERRDLRSFAGAESAFPIPPTGPATSGSMIRSAESSSPCVAFNLFFSCNRVANVAENLVPHQTLDVVSCGKTLLEEMRFVLAHAPIETVGYADVEVVRSAGENVDGVTMFFHLDYSGTVG